MPAALRLAVAVVMVLALPMLLARPADLSSDESLYLAEAYNIAHGEGVTYPSGEPVTHRAPLFPLALAPAVALGGPSAAYAVTGAVVVVNALLVLLIAWRAAGALAGAIGGLAAAAAGYLAELGTTLYLDPMQCTFLLLTVAALLEAARAPQIRWFAAAGLCAGLAFLAKESAVQWAPLGLAAWLAVPSLRSTQGLRGALAFTTAFAACATPWLLWVWVHTGELFLLGAPDATTMALVATGVLGYVALAAGATFAPRAVDRRPPAWLAPASLSALIAGWGVFVLYALTAHSSWDYPNDYWSTVPSYLSNIAPAAQPYFLLVAAWGWSAYRASRGDAHHRLLLVAALLFAPFALFIANRSLQLRDALPLVYLSYVVLGVSAAEALRAAHRRVGDAVPAWVALAALLALGGTFAWHEVSAFRAGHTASSTGAVHAQSWDNPFARRIGTWMRENVPPGSRVMTSRLYFSSLHVNTGGRFEVRQLPTVRVDVDEDSERLLTPRSNLFRWGDTDLRAGEAGDTWLYLQQFPGKRYWVAMSQQELLAYTAEQDIEYVVLTGEDIAFSSLSYATYLTAHPAFELVHHEMASAADQLFVYRVHPAALAPMTHDTAMTPASFDALVRETGLGSTELEALLGTALRVTDADHGLSPREQQAAVADDKLPR